MYTSLLSLTPPNFQAEPKDTELVRYLDAFAALIFLLFYAKLFFFVILILI